MNFGLKKEERIHKRDELQLLFSKAQSFSIFPFKILHHSIQKENKETLPMRFAVSIPKKRFKKAVDRNLLKRRTREAYRQNRNELKQQLPSSHSLLFILIYIADEPLEYHKIEEKIILILQRLQGIYAKDNQ